MFMTFSASVCLAVCAGFSGDPKFKSYHLGSDIVLNSFVTIELNNKRIPSAFMKNNPL